jgi:glycoside/pentoside/hexuronide:cation symporter, GPH family
MTHAAIRKNELWRYSVLAIPVAFAGFPLYVLAPDYYATTHGVSLALLGMLLLALRVFDAVQDPLIGALSDRYRRHSGYFMGAAAVALPIAIYGLFNMLPVSPAAWFALCIALAVTAYSVLSINLNTLGGLWTKDVQAKTRITAWRETCGLIGLVVAVSLPVLLKSHVGEERAYFYFSLTLAVCMLMAWVVFRPWLRAHLAHAGRGQAQAGGLFSGFRAMTRRARYFLLVYGLSMLASSIPAVLVIFFVRDLLGAVSLTGVFLLLYFLSGAASMPLWKHVSDTLGKYRAWGVAMAFAALSFVWAFFLGAGDVWQYAVICALSGFALGADLALPPSILADHIHESNAEAHAATHFALLALVASAIALPVLSAMNFVPAAQNSAEALFGLSVAYALIPCLLKLASAVWLVLYFIRSKQGVIYENHQTHSVSGGTHHA